MTADFILPDDFMEITEDQPVPGGIYLVRIEEVDIDVSEKSGLERAEIVCNLPEQPDSLPVRMYLQIPGQEGIKNPKFAVTQVKRFLVAFEIPFEPGVSVRELLEGAVGSEARLTLKHVPAEGDYGAKNEIVLPRLN